MELISDEDRGRNGYNDDHETYVQVIAHNLLRAWRGLGAKGISASRLLALTRNV